MRRIFNKLAPLLALWWGARLSIGLLAAFVLLFTLGSHGFLEPSEIKVVERIAKAEQRLAKLREKGPTNEKSSARPPTTPLLLTESLAQAGMRAFGKNELGARLPLAVCGVLLIVVTYLLGLRLGGERAGVVSALVLLSCPLFLVQARHLMGDIGGMLGQSALILGAIGLLWPRDEARKPSVLFFDVGMVLLGGSFAYLGGGVLIGLVAPLSAIAIAGLYCWQQGRAKSHHRRPIRLAGGACLFAVATVLAVVWFFVGTFNMSSAEVGDRMLAGQTLVPEPHYTSTVQGIWRGHGNLDITFNSLFEQIGLGGFPWVVLMPLAVLALVWRKDHTRQTFAGAVVFLWASTAWIFTALIHRKVGPWLYPALPALAVAVGVWLAPYLTRGAHADGGQAPRVPLVALFVFFVALVVGKDLAIVVEELVSEPEKFTVLWGLKNFIPTEHPRPQLVVFVFAVVFGGLVALSLAVEAPLQPRELACRKKRVWRAVHALRVLNFAGRGWLVSKGLVAALWMSALFGVLFAQVFAPRISRQLSAKESFVLINGQRAANTRVAIMSKKSYGPEFYAGADMEILPGQSALYRFLSAKEQVFALIPPRDLCSLHAAQKRHQFEYYVLHNDYRSYFLLSNQSGGLTDRNHLAKVIRGEEPVAMKTPLEANFDGRIELMGIDMPEVVSVGDRFKVTFYYKVLKAPQKNWQVFVHFDGPGNRFHGDHDPQKTFCATQQWESGNYITDRFTVKVPRGTTTRGTYKIWTGFFVGSHGDYTNMPVLQADNKDEQNRVLVGTIQVE